jgi:hypothetical protein
VHGFLKSGSSMLRERGGRICSVSGPSCDGWKNEDATGCKGAVTCIIVAIITTTTTATINHYTDLNWIREAPNKAIIAS